MKVLIFATVLTAAFAARLENTYLPPQGAQGAGGGSFLGAPSAGPQAPHFGIPGAGSGGFAPHQPGPDAGAQTLRFDNENNGDSYRYSYETSNHIQAQEHGQASVPGPEGNAIAAQGSFGYTSPEGQQYTLTYTADENGFQPQGAHLPTPPPIPPEILKSLEQNAAEEAAQAQQGYASGNQGGSGGYPSGGPGQSFNPQSGYKY